MPKISVIVPVYNVENYLRQCLDSIIAQTFSDIEIICVNDGSEDSSRAILETYSQKDNRIKIIDKENGGLSSARNAGMKIAEGEFISFIDSDDWVNSEMLEKLYKNIMALNTDISICAVNLYDETLKKNDSANPYFSLGYFDETFDGLDPVVRNLMKKILAKQMETKTTTIIMTSHNLRELEDICDNLGLLYKGGILFESEVDSLKTNIFKVQISLKEDFSEKDFEKLNILNFKKTGSVATMIVKGEKKEYEKYLKEKNPIILDFLTLTLE